MLIYETSSTLTTRGQVTIPRVIRERLSLQAGHTLLFELRADGTLEIHISEGQHAITDKESP